MKTYDDIVGDGGSDILGQVAERTARLRARMALITHKLAVMSGKGGVGKSAVSVNLAAALAMQGRKVGILDADINGPCVARMLGVQSQRLQLNASGVAPAVGPLGIKVVSTDLLLPREGAPVAWGAPTREHRFVWLGTIEAAALHEFLADTLWGELDFLVIDLPPGSERFAALHGMLPECDGTIVVTIPSRVAGLTVERSVALARSEQATLLGVVENMAGYWCEKCGALLPLFPDEENAAEQALGVPVLGRIPFDPRIARCSDQGVPFVIAYNDTPAGCAFMDIVAAIYAQCAAGSDKR